MLFPDAERTDASPKRATETDIAFLDRCSWASAELVRQLLNSCIANFPADDAPELVARLRSGDARHFRSASFELLLHAYMLRLGFMLTPHPLLSNGSAARPDFLVECPDGRKLYVEAVCASDNDGRDVAAEARKAVALQVLDAVAHPAFMVDIDSEGDPDTQPRGRRLANAVVTWLDRLDPDELLACLASEGREALPVLTWSHEGWLVRVRPIPMNKEARGQSRRLIGIRNFGAGWIDGWTPIRDAVTFKAAKYGDLELPLVVAVNVDAFNLDPIDEAQALFGQEQFVFNGVDPEPRLERAPNGAWHGPAGPRGLRASGAWLFNHVTPYTLARRRRHTLYVNPWAAHQVPESFLSIPHATVIEGFLRRTDGTGIGEALGLEATWPE